MTQEKTNVTDNHVFITGAAGFIGGGCVYEFLERGWKITALAHKSYPKWMEDLEKSDRIEVVRGTITDAVKINECIEKVNQRCRISSVVHCAGWASDTGRETNFRELTLKGTRNIVNAVLNSSIPKFVYISTTDVYGILPHDEADENTPLDNNLGNNYPGYKILAEREVRNLLPIERTVIVRPAAVWGPGDTTILPRILRYLKTTPRIFHFGGAKGQNRWPHVYIKNVTKVIFAATVSPLASGNIYNVCDRENTSIDNYYRLLIKTCLPEREQIKSITLPFIIGFLLGKLSDFSSAVLNTYQPVFDPSSYALYSVSTDMKFSSAKAEALLDSIGENFISSQQAWDEFAVWEMKQKSVNKTI